MSEITSLGESPVSYYSDAESEARPFWKKGGGASFCLFGVIAMGACFSAPSRKRRFTIGPVGQQSSEEIATESAPNDPLNVPCKPPELNCRKQDIENIHVIFKTLSVKRGISLLPLRAELTQRGDAIDHLHPLKLLEILFLDSELKKSIKTIIEFSSWDPTKKKFISGIEKGMKREAGTHNIAPHIKSFAEKLGIPDTPIRQLIHNRAWEQLIHHLIEKTA